MTDVTWPREALLAALAWQIELGADEAIAERPLDRLAKPGTGALPPRESRASTQAPAAPARARGPHTEATARPVTSSAAPRERSAGNGGTGDARPGLLPSPTDLADGAATLDALRAAVAQHGEQDSSGLAKGARSLVFSDGRPGAHLMVIGEAPGADEDRQGLPFVGRAGQLLDRMLGAIGLSRAAESAEHAVYITNILPWRPPGNRTPSEAEMAAFVPFVERHIALAAPRILLTIGNTPTKALTGTTSGIRRMRGKWLRHDASGLPILPSFHPAYLLRQPAEKALAWADLLTLKQALRDPDALESLLCRA